MARQSVLDAREIQFAPESVEVQMFPPQTTAASLVPSLEEVMPYQVFVTPTPAGSRSVQVAPESLEVQMFPTYSTAASLVPSLEEVIQCQFCPGQRGIRGRDRKQRQKQGQKQAVSF